MLACAPMTHRRILGGIAWLALAAAAGAQSNDEIQTATQLNLSAPGARSLGLGGAFLAVADDATAAYANPAGLTQLPRPEVSLEGRAFRFTSRFPDSGHLPPTGVTGRGVDTVDGLRFGEIVDETASISFASAVWAGRRWAASIYHHRLTDFQASLVSHGPFFGPRDGAERVLPARSHLALEVEGPGVAAAVRLPAGLSLGLAVASYRFSLSSLTSRYARAERTGDPFTDALTGSFFGPADFTPENVSNFQTQEGDDRALAFQLGALARLGERWSVAAVFRQGPRFDFDARFVYGPRGDLPGAVDPEVGGPGIFRLPDVWGLGVAYRPLDGWVVAFDWDRVRYSDMTRELVNLLRIARGEVDRFQAEDADELHLGVEYQTLRWRSPVAVRLGAWLDPDHRIRYTGDNAALSVRFRAGEDALHLTAGLGLVVHRIQLDLAYDRSAPVETLSLSAVARF